MQLVDANHPDPSGNTSLSLLQQHWPLIALVVVLLLVWWWYKGK